MTASLEVARVAAHIQRAGSLAAARDCSSISHVQRLVRRLLLQALAAYRAEGQFPKNRDFAEPRPYFIDADGTRCAMAHLMELGGERELVQAIARERNNAYVRELADDPRLVAWLAAAGLTVEEAAAIQPEYCSIVSDCICGGDFSFTGYPVPARGAVEGVVLANGKVRVDRTYGDSLGVVAGSELELATPRAAGTHVIAPIDSAAQPVHAVVIEQDEFHCSSQGVQQAPPLTPAELAAAVTATDCAAHLRAQDEAWGKSSCEQNEEPDLFDGDGGGCSASGEAASVGILLALVTALATRRR
jgi:hypothetical protein